MEKLYFTNNKTTGIGVAEARGGDSPRPGPARRAPVWSIPPMQVKQAVTGYGKAVKPQVQEMTRRLLGLQKVPPARRYRRRLGLGHLPWPGSGKPLAEDVAPAGP